MATPEPTAPAASADVPFIVQQVEGWTVVEFRTSSLMDPIALERIAGALYPIVDEQDRRKVVLDFTSVQYLSSQAIGILLTLHRKLAALPHSKLVLCGVSKTLMQLLTITRLDRVLTIKPTQREAIKTSTVE